MVLGQRENDAHNREDAAKLLERLTDIYLDYSGKNFDQGNPKRGVARLFRKWFTSFDSLSVNSVHQEFLDEVGRIVKKLSLALEELKTDDADACMGFAGQAVSLMLAPKPTKEKTTAEWYLTIAEYQCTSILPFVSYSELKRTREDMLKRTPKRLMYPRQREMIELMESLIIKKHKIEKYT